MFFTVSQVLPLVLVYMVHLEWALSVLQPGSVSRCQLETEILPERKGENLKLFPLPRKSYGNQGIEGKMVTSC